MRPALEERLAELKDYMEDRAAGEVFARAKGTAVLNGKWREAIDGIRAYTAQNPSSLRRGEKLVSELEDMWIERKRARFHRVKNEEFDRAVRRFLSSRKPDLATARSWATTQLPDEIKRRTQRRLDLSAEELEMFLESKAKSSPHWASYWTGSFVVSKRATRGKSTSRAIRGDPEDWWDRYGDISVRASWLKAYTAERVELFEVVQINNHPCERCGGTGKVKKWSPTPAAGGKHEWLETCPRCFGARVERGVGYR